MEVPTPPKASVYDAWGLDGVSPGRPSPPETLSSLQETIYERGNAHRLDYR